jgi:transcription elongation factor GreA
LVKSLASVVESSFVSMAEEALSLEELARRFLTSLPTEERADKQQEINRFVLWYGKERSVSHITPTEVETYAQWTAASTGDVNKKLEPVRALLSYAKKEKLTKTSLAPHLRIKQAHAKGTLARKPKQQQIALTANDHADLKTQLAALEEERVQVAEEMRIAAADKDFRENAPLHAARERAAHIEARMNDIQASLTTGVIVNAETQAESLTARLGSTVILQEMATGEKRTYKLATKNEANPANGKISIISPLGKAVLNQHEGDVVKVVAPAGEILYKIEKID